MRASLTGEEIAPLRLNRDYKVHSVADGHQFALIYDLVITEAVGAVLQKDSIADSANIPLYRQVKEILEKPRFWPKGSLTHSF